MRLSCALWIRHRGRFENVESVPKALLMHMFGNAVHLNHPRVIKRLQEWEQRQADKKRLAKMREHHAKGRRWDVTRGEWIDQ